MYRKEVSIITSLVLSLFFFWFAYNTELDLEYQVINSTKFCFNCINEPKILLIKTIFVNSFEYDFRSV